LQPQTDDFPGYAYCESVGASSISPWHIRKLKGGERKLGGGIDSSSLCKRVNAGAGWDLQTPITKTGLEKDHVCKKCQTALVESTK
jgi:hypothetical protein